MEFLIQERNDYWKRAAGASRLIARRLKAQLVVSCGKPPWFPSPKPPAVYCWFILWNKNPHRTPKSRKKRKNTSKKQSEKTTENKKQIRKTKINKIKTTGKQRLNRRLRKKKTTNKQIKIKKRSFAAKCWFWRKNLGNLLNIGKKSGKCRFESGIESSVESGCVSFNRIGEKN